MKIAVNTRLLLPDKLEGIGRFTHEILKRMTKNHPEDEFIFFFDREYDPKYVYGENVTPLILPPKARHPILFYYWFDFVLHKALRQHQPDIFFSPDGYLCLKTDVPSIPVIHDINFEHRPKDLRLRDRIYYRNFFPKFAQKASKIITVSKFSKEDICSTYNINPEKIEVVYNGVREEFKPLTTSEKEEFKKPFSHGKNYFLYVGALHPRKNIKRLILAFEQYKKTTNNDFLLILVGEKMWTDDSLEKVLNNSPYKSDIILKGHIDQKTLYDAYAAAFALMNVSLFEGFGIPIIEAMKSETPVITSNVSSLPEIADKAALIVNPRDINEIAHAMTRLTENNELREEFIRNGIARAADFDWDKSAEQVYEVLTSVNKLS
jgi:glycosyltransferase involved in cell wall biosynthesis